MGPRETIVRHSLPTSHLYAEQVVAELIEESVLTMRELKEAFRLDILELEEIIPQPELIRFDKKMAIDSDKAVFRIEWALRECRRREMSSDTDTLRYY